MTTDPSFTIPRRPNRRYPASGGVEYEGETIFRLTPAEDRPDEQLRQLTESVLDEAAYTYGDWFDLPMPLYLVHDEGTDDVFRVAVRNGSVELHVLPETEPDGLRRLYERLCERTGCGWQVQCHTDG